MAIANAFLSPAAAATFAPVRSKLSHSDCDFLTPHLNLSFSASSSKLTRGLFHSGITTKRNISCASIDGVESKSVQDRDGIPMPIVLIDQDSDSDATIVQVSFGDRLGTLIDTFYYLVSVMQLFLKDLKVVHESWFSLEQMKALKDLGLDVVKGTVNTEASVIETKFFITHL
nr:ACT domain-containing protein ACR12-like [Coffea arabica]